MSINGTVGAGYEAVADALAANAHPTGEPGESGYDPGDLGASLCVIRGGEVMVDAWHGDLDLNGSPWQRDTLVNMYSVGKPVAAVLALDAVARGELNLDTPLANVWPELATHSSATTLRHALTHQAGLPALAADLNDDDIVSWSTMTKALAATPPWWEPGSAHGYHVNTFGFMGRRAGVSSRREQLPRRPARPHLRAPRFRSPHRCARRRSRSLQHRRHPECGQSWSYKRLANQHRHRLNR